MSPLKKFIKCFNSFINRVIELPEIIINLIGIPIMEHSDIEQKVKLYDYIWENNDDEYFSSLDEHLSDIYLDKKDQKFKPLKKDKTKKNTKDCILKS